MKRFCHLEAMRQHHGQQLPLRKFQQVIELQMTFALLGIVSSLAASEELTQPAVSFPIARIDQNVRRAIHEDEARTDQKLWLVFDVGIFEFLVSPHHACQRIVVGDADDGKAQIASLMHVILRMRSAAQERKIRGDSDFGITMGVHANNPCTNQLEGTGLPSSLTSSLL